MKFIIIGVLLHITYIWDEYFPQRCAIPGKTRVSFDFKEDAGILPSEESDLDSHKSGTGLIIDFQYDYVAQSPADNRLSGVYLSNSKFPPQGYIVRLDETDRLVSVPLRNARLISDFGYAIKAAYRRHGLQAKVCDHKPPLVGVKGDIVRLTTDAPDTVRTIIEVRFTPLGKARYCVSMVRFEILAENKRRHDEAKARDRAWCSVNGSSIRGIYNSDNIVFIRKGDKSGLDPNMRHVRDFFDNI